MTNPAALEATVTRSRASSLLSVGERRLRALVAAGVLRVQGQGHASRITLASVAAEVARREIRKSRQANPGTLGDSRLGVPNFDDSCLDGDADRQQNGIDDMLLRFPNQAECEPVAELLSLSRAAALVGVSDDRFRRAVNSGQVPSVALGKRRLVEKNALRDWVRGTTATKGVR